VTRGCDTGVWHGGVTQGCDTEVWHRGVTQGCGGLASESETKSLFW